MKRVIKFRAWAYNKMYDWQQIKDRMILEDLLNHPDFNVMQFTGLHDKNGEEIWEGDIVAFDRGDGVIIEEKVTFEAGTFYPICERVAYEYTIIGNIYENPELL